MVYVKIIMNVDDVRRTTFLSRFLKSNPKIDYNIRDFVESLKAILTEPQA